MADAIPVHSEPRKAPKIKAPSFDNNGIQLPDDYVSTVRENLGDPALFQGDNSKRREMTSLLDKPDGSQHVHTYIREDY